MDQVGSQRASMNCVQFVLLTLCESGAITQEQLRTALDINARLVLEHRWGPEHPELKRSLGAWVRDDAEFDGYVLLDAYRAKPLVERQPRAGDLVFVHSAASANGYRPATTAHVGFFVGYAENGSVRVLGLNADAGDIEQKDAHKNRVQIERVDPARVTTLPLSHAVERLRGLTPLRLLPMQPPPASSPLPPPAHFKPAPTAPIRSTTSPAR